MLLTTETRRAQVASFFLATKLNFCPLISNVPSRNLHTASFSTSQSIPSMGSKIYFVTNPSISMRLPPIITVTVAFPKTAISVPLTAKTRRRVGLIFSGSTSSAGKSVTSQPVSTKQFTCRFLKVTGKYARSVGAPGVRVPFAFTTVSVWSALLFDWVVAWGRLGCGQLNW